ncbi:hypothetical protein OHR68_43240 [Spirillospora sp. NBC_00431]
MDRWDLLALLGVACLGAGLWLVAPWLGITAVGLVLLAGGIVGGVVGELRATRAARETQPGTGH